MASSLKLRQSSRQPSQVLNDLSELKINHDAYSSNNSITRRVRRPQAAKVSQRKSYWPIYLFLTGLFIPWIVPVGPLRLSLYRLVLLALFLPCLFMWVTLRSGRIRIADLALVLFCLWSAGGLIALHGLEEALQPAGITIVETLGAYLLARCYIRSADDFRNMAFLLYRIIIIILPFAIIEATTGQKVLLRIFGIFLPTYDDIYENRRGLWRVQGSFEHPILFGVCCGCVFVLAYLVLGYRTPVSERIRRAGFVGLTAFLSLSSGPIFAVAIQGILICWRWCRSGMSSQANFVMVLLLTAAYVLAEAFTSRSISEIILTSVTFDTMSYWSRNLIWVHASESVLNHPFLGVGLGRWDRPLWMAASIDNFWLYFAVKHGLPSVFFLSLTIASSLLAINFNKALDEREAQYRAAYQILIVGFCFVGTTVHFWDATLALFLFLLGSGAWILEVKRETEPRVSFGEVDLVRRQKVRHGKEESRFQASGNGPNGNRQETFASSSIRPRKLSTEDRAQIEAIGTSGASERQTLRKNGVSGVVSAAFHCRHTPRLGSTRDS